MPSSRVLPAKSAAAWILASPEHVVVMYLLVSVKALLSAVEVPNKTKQNKTLSWHQYAWNISRQWNWIVAYFTTHRLLKSTERKSGIDGSGYIIVLGDFTILCKAKVYILILRKRKIALQTPSVHGFLTNIDIDAIISERPCEMGENVFSWIDGKCNVVWVNQQLQKRLRHTECLWQCACNTRSIFPDGHSLNEATIPKRMLDPNLKIDTLNGSPHHWYNTAHYLVSLCILTGGNPDFINITFFKFETFTFFYWWQNIMASIFSSATRVMGEPNITQLMLDACTLHSELYQRMRKGEIGTFCRGCWMYLKRERQLFTFRFIVMYWASEELHFCMLSNQII